MIEDITPLVITYNEAPNIARTLDRLVWAKRIVVIDSGSTEREPRQWTEVIVWIYLRVRQGALIGPQSWYWILS